ncbi:MAG: uracil-DNA glycosylase [Actinobacteria bacterium]|nr:uracil-DNA glycosylase [Actinomycetota bacterium]
MRAVAELDTAICGCRRCPRLIDWCAQVALEKRASYREEEYWGGPVPGFGSVHPRIWIVGLAPGAHGANRTGRMFTGDRSGDWLYGSLHRVGLARIPASHHREDGQHLEHVRITAAVHCAPPANKPTPDEIHRCGEWLTAEAALVRPSLRVGIALGSVAWAAMWRVLGSGPRPRFGHGVRAESGGVTLLGSYHPSQQNTFTGRLTEQMLDEVLGTAAGLSRGLP